MEFRFTVDRPKMEKRARGAGEDAPAVAKDGILIVCDGAGATGQSKHEIDGQVHTSAYLGSRQTSAAVEDFLTENYDIIINAVDEPATLQQLALQLGAAIRTRLTAFVNEHNLKLTVIGKTFKLLPTTLASAVYKIYDDRVDIVVFSAGDSRVLFWDAEKGLQQLSIDDIDENADAFTDICNITNCISADFDFRINYTVYSLPVKQFILIATSDGFTDSAKPFDQEKMLLQTIGFCKNSILDEENSELSKIFGDVLDRHQSTGKDDCSIAGLIAGFESDKELTECIFPRFSYTREAYTVPYLELNKKTREAMDRYNTSQTQYRIRQNRLTDRLRANALKCSDYLFGEEKEKNPSVYAFVSSLPYIQSEENRIKSELEAKRRSALERSENLKKRLENDFIDLLRQIGFFPADIELKSWLPPVVASELQTYVQSSEKKRSAYENFNSVLRRIKDIPALDMSSGPLFSFEELSSSCDSLILAAGEVNEVERLIQRSEKIVEEFFSPENPEIRDMFEKGLSDGFTELSKCVEALSPRKKGFPFFPASSEQRDLEHKFRLLSSRFESFLSLYKEYGRALTDAESAEITDDHRRRLFRTQIEKNINDVIERIKRDDEMFRFFAEDDKAELDRMLTDINMAEEETRNLIALKNDMWKKYKQDYELFAFADVKAAVNIPKSNIGE